MTNKISNNRRQFLKLAGISVGSLAVPQAITAKAYGKTNLQTTLFNDPRVINIKDFGATGTGNNLETQVLQNALNHIASLGGGVIYFPPGQYKIDNELLIETTGSNNMDNITLLGAGKELVKLQQVNPDTSGIKVKYATNIHIEGFSIIGTGILPQDTFPNGIDFRGATNSSVINCLCTDWGHHGIFLGYQAHNNVVANNHCTKTVKWNGISILQSNHNHVLFNQCDYNGDQGIEIRDSSYCIVEGNYFINNAGTTITGPNNGLGLEQDANYNIVKGNVISGNNGPGVGITSSQHNIITNNMIEANTSFGIFLMHNASYDNPSYFNQIQNNHINDNDRGIRVYQTADVTITNNYIVNNTKFGIHLEGNNCQRCEIIGNRVWDNGRHGVYLEYRPSYCNVSDNKCYNNGNGDNTNSYDGICVTQGDRNVINGNICIESSRYGINIADSNCDKNIVTSNVLFPNDIATFNNQGSNTQVANNILT